MVNNNFEKFSALELEQEISALKQELSIDEKDFRKWLEREKRRLTAYFEFPPLEIYDRLYKFIGVSHEPSTFIKNKQELRRIIESKETNSVVLEYFIPEKHGKVFKETKELGDIEKAMKKLENTLSSDMLFYGAIASLAAVNNKDVVVVNPENRLSHFIYIIPSALAVMFFLNTFRIARKKVYNRREFFKLIGSAIAALGLSGLSFMFQYGNSIGRLEFVNNVRQSLKDNNIITPDDIPELEAYKSIFCLYDYRDCGTALALSQFINSVNKGEMVAHVEGTGHALGIFRYLKDPEKARLRMAMYNNLLFKWMGKEERYIRI